MRTTIVRWREWTNNGLEHLVLRPTDNGLIAESAVLSGSPRDGFAATYRIVCDSAWRVREVRVSVVDTQRTITLASDGNGTWTAGDATPLPDLAGAIDVDITATPFTNTLPIRRLQWGPGGSAEILVAYVSLPELAITLEPQRYTYLGPRRFRFESVGSDFMREIDVDDDGLVVTYPGLFQRVVE
jgi:uncharacterized protein